MPESAFDDLGNIAGVFMGIKPSSTIDQETALWIEQGLSKVYPNYKDIYDFVPVEEPEIDPKAQHKVVFFINKKEFLAKINQYKRYFNPAMNYTDAMEKNKRYLSVSSPDSDVQLRTGLLLGYPLEDYVAYATYARLVNQQIMQVLEKNGKELRKLKEEDGLPTLTKREVKTLSKFEQTKELGLKGVQPNAQRIVADNLQPEVSRIIAKIPGIDPQVAAYYLCNRVIHVKGIRWTSVGSPKQRRDYADKIKKAFEKSGMEEVFQKNKINFIEII